MQAIAIDVADVDLYMSQTCEQRQFAAASVADRFLSAPVNSPNRAAYKKLLKLSLSDKDVGIQNHIASLVAKSPTLPGDIACHIILCDLEIGDWLLKHFRRFAESDLYTLLLTGSLKIQNTLANRSDLTEQITDYICQHCELATAEICLKNQSAPITEQGYRNLLERYVELYPEITNLILKRHNLPEKLITLILSKTEVDLQKILSAFKTLPIDIENKAIQHKGEKELTEMISTDWLTNLKRKAVQQLLEDKRLSHTLILRKYLALDGEFVLMAISAKSGRSEKEINDLLHDKNYSSFSAILKQTKPPEYLKPAFKKLSPHLLRMIDASQEEKNLLRANFLHQLRRIYNFKAPLTLEEIIDKLLQFSHT